MCPTAICVVGRHGPRRRPGHRTSSSGHTSSVFEGAASLLILTDFGTCRPVLFGVLPDVGSQVENDVPLTAATMVEAVFWSAENSRVREIGGRSRPHPIVDPSTGAGSHAASAGPFGDHLRPGLAGPLRRPARGDTMIRWCRSYRRLRASASRRRAMNSVNVGSSGSGAGGGTVARLGA